MSTRPAISGHKTAVLEAITRYGGYAPYFAAGWMSADLARIEVRSRLMTVATKIDTATIKELADEGYLIEFGPSDFSGRRWISLPELPNLDSSCDACKGWAGVYSSAAYSR